MNRRTSQTGLVLSQQAIRELWTPTEDFGCTNDCQWERYYAYGFFTDTPAGQPVNQVQHAGGRAGFTSAFVLRPEANLAVAILVNSNMELTDVALDILDDFE